MMAWFSKEKVPGSPMQCQQLTFFRLSPTRVFPSIPIAFLHLPSFCFFPLLFCTWLFLLPLNNIVFLHLCSFPLQFLNLWAQWIWGIFVGCFIKTEKSTRTGLEVTEATTAIPWVVMGNGWSDDLSACYWVWGERENRDKERSLQSTDNWKPKISNIFIPYSWFFCIFGTSKLKILGRFGPNSSAGIMD